MRDTTASLLHRGGRAGTWGSLGLWPGADEPPGDYAGACRALARAVGRAAGIVPGGRVLSVACGAGAELLLWRELFGAAQVLGVEADAERVREAQELVGGAGAAIQVRLGSGTALPALGLAPASFDAVVCVDAAYHLRPRSAFLDAAFGLLRPGGRLAYTDLLIDDEGDGARWKAAVLRTSARACGLVADDLLRPQAQLRRLRACGFADPQLQRLDEAVLGGFVRHVRAQEAAFGGWLRPTARSPAWRRPAFTARLIPPCRKAGLGYALISALRPSTSEAHASGQASMASAAA